jgi:zinc resistance-associated protein
MSKKRSSIGGQVALHTILTIGGLTMKKILITTALAGVIGLAGLQTATAGPGYGYGGGYCRDFGIDRPYDDGIGSKALEKFREETTALRKELAVKRGEYRALMQQDNPDEKRAAALSGELFDLRNELRQKAAERGLSGSFGCGGYGRHMMADDRWEGRGRHRGNHMWNR